MAYEKLKVEKFGQLLIQSQDLDPVYVGLCGANFPSDQLKRWLVWYWSFYSAGTACYASEHKGEKFWDLFYTAVLNEQPTPLGTRWQRGAERRYYRGKQGLDSYLELRAKYPHKPEEMANFIISHPWTDPKTLRKAEDISKRAQLHRGFGPWIGFKIADMVERVLRIPVDFSLGDIMMFTDPAKAADKVWTEAWGNAPVSNQRKTVCAVLQGCYRKLGVMAPPHNDRPIGIQEVETVLCKWKSHCNNHYPLGKDTHEVRESLTEWGTVSEAARQMLSAMPH